MLEYRRFNKINMACIIGIDAFFRYHGSTGNNGPSRMGIVDENGREIKPAQIPVHCMIAIAARCTGCHLWAQPGTSGTHIDGSCQGIGSGFVAFFPCGQIPPIANCSLQAWEN